MQGWRIHLDDGRKVTVYTSMSGWADFLKMGRKHGAPLPDPLIPDEWRGA